MGPVERERWQVRPGIPVVCPDCGARMQTDGSEGVQPRTFRLSCPECGQPIMVTNWRS